MHRVAASVFFLPLLVYAQAPKAIFEAASIKPSDPSSAGYSWNTYPGRLTVQNLSLKNLIMLAWDVKSYPIAGGPKWLDGDRFNVVAKMDESEANAARGKEADARIRMALQALLTDRFQLRIHADSKPLSAYSLVAARSGFRLRPVKKVHGRSSSWGGSMDRQRKLHRRICQRAFQPDGPARSGSHGHRRHLRFHAQMVAG